MELMTAGVTTREASVDDVTWHILGQTYVPKHRSESSMSWHADAVAPKVSREKR